jgi:tetratricopeptide (TPR) repeat protein
MKPALLVSLTAALLLAPSCKSWTQKITGPVEAVITLSSSTPGLLEQAGVRALRAADWELAKTGFSQALIDNSEDHASHYGMGIAYEQLDKLPMALACYETALRFSTEEPNPDYAAAVARVRGKLGR